MPFPVGGPLERSLCLHPFSRYWALSDSVVVKDLRLEDKDKDKDLMSKDEDTDEDLSFKDKDEDKDLGRH